jgi:hypothetical protein
MQWHANACPDRREFSKWQAFGRTKVRIKALLRVHSDALPLAVRRGRRIYMFKEIIYMQQSIILHNNNNNNNNNIYICIYVFMYICIYLFIFVFFSCVHLHLYIYSFIYNLLCRCTMIFYISRFVKHIDTPCFLNYIYKYGSGSKVHVRIADGK